MRQHYLLSVGWRGGMYFFIDAHFLDIAYRSSFHCLSTLIFCGGVLSDRNLQYWGFVSFTETVKILAIGSRVDVKVTT